MRGRSGTASIVASPVLVGAVTVLVAIVAVFLAYNANAGLPFVPTYDVNAEVPSGAKLVRGNDVRVGGFRVGVVDEIKPKTVQTKEGPHSVALLHMKLDKSIEPIKASSAVIVRPRSALGLKYVELAPGTKGGDLKAGSTISNVAQLSAEQLKGPVDLEDVLGTFDKQTRENSRDSLTGFGDALSGRGQDLNVAIEELAPFATALTPVMRNLSSRRTQLEGFFRSLGRVSAEVAPVAAVQAELFTNMADTFAAIGACATCLQKTIERGPATLDAAITGFPVQRRFVADFADLSGRLRPAARTLRDTLPQVNAALVEGQPVLRRSVDFNRRTGRVFGALRALVANPNTTAGISDLRGLLKVGRPLVEYVAPYQTVCNYWNYFFGPLATHQSYGVTGGNYQRVLSMSGNMTQTNRVSGAGAFRPADIPANFDVHTAKDPTGEPLQRQFGPPYQPAIDAQGNADCQAGQTGFMQGPLTENGLYPPATAPTASDPAFAANKGGGSHVLAKPNFPGLSGPTDTGVPNLKAVP